MRTGIFPITILAMGVLLMLAAFMRLRLSGNAYTVSSMQTIMICGAIIIAGGSIAFAIVQRRIDR